MQRPEVAILHAGPVDEPWLLRLAVPAELGIHSDDLEVALVAPAVRTWLDPSCETQVSMILEDHSVDVAAVANWVETDQNIQGAHGDP